MEDLLVPFWWKKVCVFIFFLNEKVTFFYLIEVELLKGIKKGNWDSINVVDIKFDEQN